MDARIRPRGIAAWLVCAVGVVLLAHALLSRAVDQTLTAAIEDATGEAAQVGDVEVSLLGSLRLTDLRLGNIASAARLETNLSLSALIGGELRPAEVVVSRPRMNLADGGARLQRVARRIQQTRGARARAQAITGPQKRAQTPHIRAADGIVRVDAGERGNVLLRGFSIRSTDRGIRVVAESTVVETTLAGRVVSAELGRGAADINLIEARVERAISGSGVIRVADFEPFRDVEVSYGLDGDQTLRLVSAWGGGSLTARGTSSKTELSFAAVPAALVSGLVGGADLRSGRVSGNIGVTRRADGAQLTGSLLLDNVRGVVPWLSKSEIDLASEIAGTAAVTWKNEASLTISDLHVRRGDVVATLVGSLSKSEPELASLRGSLELTLPEIRCSTLATDLPLELVGPLRGIRLAGRISGRATLDIGVPGSRPVELDVDLPSRGCRVLKDAPGADVAKLKATYEHPLPSGRRVTLRQGRKGYVSLRALPSHVAAAFVVAEDGRFYQHKGFDDRQIESSIAKNLAVEHFARGGSTISQQLAKNLYLTRERTFGRKLAEAALAWRIEATLSKSQILERYLNIIQLSESIYGIDAAARHWFGKSARRLSPREAAFLASLTRAPTTTSREIASSGGLTPAMVRRVEHILKSMHFVGAIDANVLGRERRASLRLSKLVASAE